MRPKLPVVFGGGLDRDTGVLSVSPQAMEEARNVVLHDGKAESRFGMENRGLIGSDGGYISAVAAARVQHLGIIVVTDNSGVSRVYSTNGNGGGVADRGIWHNPSRSTGKTRAIVAESGSYVILAHDEVNLIDRARTMYYDSSQASTPITPLTATWAAGSGADTYIRFRGVTHWLEYLVGWGFGTNEVPSSAMVRISEPGEPLVFTAGDWIIVGQPGDPVIACVPLRAGLLVYKESETHIITGNQAENFGVFGVEDRYGCAAPRLATVVGDTAYAWSLTGPRRSRGGPSEDIGWPLGLPWPSAEDIAANNLLQDGFATFDPVLRQVLFIFGDLVYAFAVEDQKWAHWKLSVPVLSAGIIYRRDGYTGPSRGYPDITTFSSTAPDTMRVEWTNENAEGDELLELWLYESGVATEVAKVTRSAFGSLSHDFTGLKHGTEYTVALRYLRDNEYTSATQDEPAILPDGSVADYTGAYTTWPSLSRATARTQTSAPTISSTAWQRNSATQEQIALSITPTSDNDIEILRGGVVIATLVVPAGGWGATVAYNDLSDDEALADPNTWGEKLYSYTARHTSGGTPGPESAAVTQWAGPTPTPILDSVTLLSNGGTVNFNVATAHPGEIWDSVNGTWGNAFAAGVTSANFGFAAQPAGTTVNVQVRYAVTSFTVTDYSDESNTVSGTTP